eukprot:6344576-Lingulodinium_polyedra.AAC.1
MYWGWAKSLSAWRARTAICAKCARGTEACSERGRAGKKSAGTTRRTRGRERETQASAAGGGKERDWDTKRAQHARNSRLGG